MSSGKRFHIVWCLSKVKGMIKKMKKSIGILYICTGPYVLFWKDFYESFEKKFLEDYEKRYFVFTDAKEIYAEDKLCVTKIPIEAQPWPLITLFRFDTFLKIEDELKKCDYLMFSNANMICDEIINSEEFLPRVEMQETLSVTLHPGYYGKSRICFPYERSKRSTAYVPWNCGENYVIGAMFCGTSLAFLEMSRILKRNIEEDLKKNIIAKWHDESQLNRYIINKSCVRILSPEYCYPYGMKVDYPKKISAVSKQAKFDVKTFKGQYVQKSNKLRQLLGNIKRKAMIKERIFYAYDFLRNARIEEIKNAE